MKSSSRSLLPNEASFYSGLQILLQDGGSWPQIVVARQRINSVAI
jgi:hypothetical protein